MWVIELKMILIILIFFSMQMLLRWYECWQGYRKKKTQGGRRRKRKTWCDQISSNISKGAYDEDEFSKKKAKERRWFSFEQGLKQYIVGQEGALQMFLYNCSFNNS